MELGQINILLIARQETLQRVTADFLTEAGATVHVSACIPRQLPADLDVVLLDSARVGCYQNQLECASATLLVYGVAQHDVDTIRACAALGCRGYIHDDADHLNWIRSVSSALRNEVYDPRIGGLLNRCVSDFLAQPSEFPGQMAGNRKTLQSFGLSRRENQILKLIALDLSNKEIARHLNVELSTVKNHVHSILNKLNVERRAQAATILRNSVQNET